MGPGGVEGLSEGAVSWNGRACACSRLVGAAVCTSHGGAGCGCCVSCDYLGSDLMNAEEQSMCMELIKPFDLCAVSSVCISGENQLEEGDAYAPD